MICALNPAWNRDARRPREDELEEALGLADEDGAVEAGGAFCYFRAALALEGHVRPALEGYLGHGYLKLQISKPKT